MTPDQRAKAFVDRIVTDAEVFRDRVFETAKRLGAERVGAITVGATAVV
jgi:hypothetical protein